MSRCEWKDPDGVRCPAPATGSRSTLGTGPRLCGAHAACRSKAEGAEIIDVYYQRGQAEGLSPVEARKVGARVSGCTDCVQAAVIDVPAVIARRRHRDKQRALDVYQAALAGGRAAGLDADSAHAEAIAQVYRVAEARRLHLTPPQLTPADLRAGAGAER